MSTCIQLLMQFLCCWFYMLCGLLYFNVLFLCASYYVVMSMIWLGSLCCSSVVCAVMSLAVFIVCLVVVVGKKVLYRSGMHLFTECEQDVVRHIFHLPV